MSKGTPLYFWGSPTFMTNTQTYQRETPSYVWRLPYIYDKKTEISKGQPLSFWRLPYIYDQKTEISKGKPLYFWRLPYIYDQKAELSKGQPIFGGYDCFMGRQNWGSLSTPIRKMVAGARVPWDLLNLWGPSVNLIKLVCVFAKSLFRAYTEEFASVHCSMSPFAQTATVDLFLGPPPMQTLEGPEQIRAGSPGGLI